MTFNRAALHDPDPDPRVYTASQQHVEFRKDGAVSKMRSHKGNIPVLPQTKLCPQCPAKFTRTTHLNRHLRTHSNERVHCCDTCNSQFTRSDLLTRHKRSCNDPNANRTRRKSCLACADSKIKCDLQHPCAKCKARGKECVFVKGSGLGGTSRTTSPEIVPSDPQRQEDSMVNRLVPYPSSGSSSSAPIRYEKAMLSDTKSLRQSGKIPTTFGFSPTFSFPPSNAVNGMESFSDFCPPMPAQVEGMPTHSQTNEMYPNDLFEPFLSHLFADPLFDPMTPNEEFLRPSSPHASRDEGFNGFLSGYKAIRPQPEDSGFSSLSDPSIFVPSLPMAHPSMNSVQMPSSDLLPPEEPAAADLERYLYLFFTAFLTQVPIMHTPTWRSERIPPVLLGAMRACGALYVKTRTADDFILQTMASTREVLVQEFGENRTDSTDPVHLILAVVLLQTIGLFHQKSNERAYSNIYHGMLVMMIRRTGLIPNNSAWGPASPTEAPLEVVWQDWARHETTKRVILLSYLHDCFHSIYFALPPSYHPSEIDLCLPCEEMLWTADSPSEWFMALQQSSPYGSPRSRLVGVHMPKALSLLTGMRISSIPILLNRFSHFVLIHSILRHLFTACVEFRAGGGSSQSDNTQGMDGAAQPDVLGLQHALHNWLQSWLNCPSVEKVAHPNGEPPFTQNAVPLYWLGQVSLLAYQEGLPPFDFRYANDTKVEERFRLVKTWLRHIREMISKGDEVLLDELMKIRLQTVRPMDEGGDDQEGLLGFFPKY